MWRIIALQCFGVKIILYHFVASIKAGANSEAFSQIVIWLICLSAPPNKSKEEKRSHYTLSSAE